MASVIQITGTPRRSFWHYDARAVICSEVRLARWRVRRWAIVLGIVVCSGLTAAAPAQAQKARPTTSGPDADGDGVADAQDRCPNTPRGTRVARDGCPVQLMRPGATPAPSAPATPVAAPARPAAVTAAPGAAGVSQPAAQPPARPAPAVTPQAAAQPAVASFSAGLAIEPFSGDEEGRVPYIRQFTQQLDSAIASMVAIFRGTSGLALAGATAPTSLSQRERDRWTRCRDLHWDLQSYVAAMHDMVEDDSPAVARTAAALDSSLTAMRASVECDNISSMITAPDRWVPWGQNYAASARAFYANWYDQVRDVSEKNRAYVIAVNGTLPAARRMPVPPAMPRTPPYAGSGPR